MEKVYHIYLRKECIFHSIVEEEFNTTWKTLNALVGLMKTDYSIEDLSYEEVEKTKQTFIEGSY